MADSKKSNSIKNAKPDKNEYVVICQNMRSLFNVGSIFRTADCFGASKVYLTGITGRPPRKEISKVALGAEVYIPWKYVRQPLRLIKQLKSEGYRIVALEQFPGKSKILGSYHPKFPTALLLGYEVTGLPKNLLSACDDVIEIPMYGKKESLNVASAFAIAAYHFSQAKYYKISAK
jgi:tRNA G18 (ribose-2'-O)-methylase SpoU